MQHQKGKPRLYLIEDIWVEYYSCVEQNTAKLEHTIGCSEFLLIPSGKKSVEE